MNLLNVVLLFGFGMGAVLHVILLWLIAQRRGRRHSESVFLFLIASAAAWFVGNTISRLNVLLLKKPDLWVERASDVVCAVGIALLPSLLLHTAMLFWAEVRPRRRMWASWALTVSIYLPAMSLAPYLLALLQVPGWHEGKPQSLLTLSDTTPGKLYLMWLAVAFIQSAVLSLRLARHVDDALERRFYRIIAFILTLVPTLVLLFRIMLSGRQEEYIGPSLEVVLTYASVFPGVVMAYYIYRYNYMEFVLRRSIFHGIMTLGLICLYYFCFRLLGRYMDKHTPLRAPVVEAMLFILLVYLFPTVSERLRRLLRFIFYTEVVDAEDLIRTLERDIAADSLINLRELLGYVVRTIKEGIGVSTASLVLLGEGGAEVVGDVLWKGEPDLESITQHFPHGRWELLDRHEITDLDAIDRMRKLGLEYVFPVYSQGRLAALLALGRTRGRLPLSMETIEELRHLTENLGRALEKAELIEAKLAWERRTYESERLSSLGRLSASVAHEVKNPLGSIKAIAQVMDEELPEGHVRHKDLSLIVGEVDRLANVVNQLLTFARPAQASDGKSVVQQVLGTVLDVLGPEIRKNKVATSCELPDEPVCTAVGEDSMKEILFNLVRNAVQAMPDGGVLGVKCTHDERENVFRLEISDTGVGIPEDVRRRIFDPYFTTKQSGTGLGLSIVLNRVKEAGGRIGVQSEKGRTVFEVCLPEAAGGQEKEVKEKVNTDTEASGEPMGHPE